MPKKQPGGDFHPIGPNVTAAGREPAWACGRSPEMGLCMAAQKGPFVAKYYVVLSPTAPEDPSVLLQGRGQTERLRRERKRITRKNIRREKQDEKTEYKGKHYK